jgi:Flp pilus assembly protein TadD
MSEPAKRSLLVNYYEALLDDEDVEGFRRRVRSRYSEATLGRLCVGGDVTARRAAVVSIGLIGTMESNAVVAASLADDDPAVRELAERALWSIWFRADSPEHNATLDQIAHQITRGQTGAAIELSTTLIARAPEFAEAYNQRAIALFAEGRFADSAADCRQVLELNPFHIGALGGLAQCYMRLGDRSRALATYRRASELQPYDLGLRQLIRVMESGGS